MTLDIDGQLWNVVEFQHVKPGKGPAFVRTKLKSVMTGKVVDRTYNAGVKIDIAILEKRDMQYLYHDGSDYVFMDTKTYDQVSIPAEVVGDATQYMLENTDAVVAVHEGTPLYIELAASVALTITTPSQVFKAIALQGEPNLQPWRRDLKFKFLSSSSRTRRC